MNERLDHSLLKSRSSEDFKDEICTGTYRTYMTSCLHKVIILSKGSVPIIFGVKKFIILPGACVNKFQSANKDNKTFRQCVSAQFNRTSANNMPSKKPSKSKQADMTRIPPPIPPRPSKSVLSKSKFYKKIQASNSTPSCCEALRLVST